VGYQQEEQQTSLHEQEQELADDQEDLK